MIPILYEASETEFKTEGLGGLAETTECTVTEERNGAFELELTYPVNGVMYKELSLGRIILAKPNDVAEEQPFRIYRITRPIGGTITVYAEHISYMLFDIPVQPYSASNCAEALTGAITASMIDNPFSVWTDVTTEGAYSTTIPRSFRSVLLGEEGSILDRYSGAGGLEYEFDRWAVKLHASRGQDSGVTIEYGKNLIDLTQEESIESTYTGVLAYWTATDGSEQATGEIQYTENHESYAHEKIYILDATQDFEEKPTTDQLNARAAQYISDNNIGTPKVNLEVSFVNLIDTKEYKGKGPLLHLGLCDTASVYFAKLGIEATAKVIKTDYNVLEERMNSISLGDARTSISDAINRSVSASIKQSADATSSRLQNAIDAATDKITGGTGGHFIIGTNADGQPNETFWMDTDDAATAVKVLRANYEGIGGSSSGIGGPYNVAITTDGKINADAITTGQLDGNLVKAGTIVAGALEDSLSDKIDQASEDSATAIDRLNNGDVAGLSELRQHITMDSSGVHVKTTEDGGESVVQSNGLHVFVGDSSDPANEVARFTRNDSMTRNLSVTTFLSFGAHRVEEYDDIVDNGSTIEGTGFFWIGDVT